MSDTTVALMMSGTQPSAGHPQRVELTVGGMTCPHCPPAIEKALAGVAGVISAHVNLASKIAAIDYDANRVKIADLAKVIRTAGYVPGAAKIRLPIAQMHCASCVTRVESALKGTPGVIAATANLGTSAVDIEYDPQETDFSAIRAAIEASGHSVAERRPHRAGDVVCETRKFPHYRASELFKRGACSAESDVAARRRFSVCRNGRRQRTLRRWLRLWLSAGPRTQSGSS